jgi:hypothetical protein
MQLTKEQIMQIIKEEIESVVDEGMYMDSRKEMERQGDEDMMKMARAAEIKQQIADLEKELEELQGMMYPGQDEIGLADDPMTQEKNRLMNKIADLKK